MSHLDTGRRGEEQARALLKKRGYKLIESNARVHYGEIDVVAKKKDCYVFVEVRTRTSREFGTPEESITRRKRDKLVACALDYVSRHEKLHDCPWRIDVVAIELNGDGHTTRAEIIENAVPVD